MEKVVVVKGMNRGTMLTVSSGPYNFHKLRNVAGECEWDTLLSVLGLVLTTRNTLVYSFGELNERGCG